MNDETSASFNPIFANNWPKASDNHATKHRNFYESPYIDIELDSTEPIPKQYDTYKPWYRPQYDLNSTVCFLFVCHENNFLSIFLGYIQPDTSFDSAKSYNVDIDLIDRSELRDMFPFVDERVKIGLDSLIAILIVSRSIIHCRMRIMISIIPLVQVVIL